MSVQVQLRRGNTAQHSAFTGAAGEITVDTDKNTVVVHDGVTLGGHPLVSNAAFEVANAAFGHSNTTYVAVNSAFGVINAGFDVANSAYNKANSANVLAYNTGIGANAYTDVSTTSSNNYAGFMANAANTYAASLTPDLSPAFNKANAAFDAANSSSGFIYSTFYSFYTQNTDFGSGETYATQTLDPFGVAICSVYDCMEPIGHYENEDFGVLA